MAYTWRIKIGIRNYVTLDQLLTLNYIYTKPASRIDLIIPYNKVYVIHLSRTFTENLSDSEVQMLECSDCVCITALEV